MVTQLARRGIVIAHSLLAACVLLAQVPNDTRFTYQGRVLENGVAPSGLFDLQFRLFEVGGGAIGPTLCRDDVTVTTGLFTVELDFGQQFHAGQRELEIGVRHSSATGDCASGAYTILSPRQPLRAAPLAQRVLDPCIYRPEDFGAKVNDLVDDTSAFEAALAAIAANAPNCGVLELSAGTYNLSRTLRPTSKLVVRGPIERQAAAPTAILSFAAGVTGLKLDFPNTCTIDSAYFRMAGGPCTATLAHGIDAGAQVRLLNVWAQAFSGDGFHLVGNAAGSPATNVSEWYIEGGRADFNGGNGLFLDGPDSNAGVAIGLSVTVNRQWGIYDSSFLGNTFIACHADGNGNNVSCPSAGGSYKVDNLNARSVFLGCYAEQNQTPAQIDFPSRWIGGLGNATGTGIILTTGVGASSYSIGKFANPIGIANAGEGGGQVEFVGGGATGSLFELWSENDSAIYPWRMKYRGTTGQLDKGWYRLDHANLDSRIALRLSGEQADVGAGHLWLNNHFIGGTNSSPLNRVRVGVGTTPPATQSATDPWPVGSIFWNKSPTAGGWSGWRCTSVAGDGVTLTWKRFGQLEP
ncbi:MAG: hypothetical protein U1D55_14755 [Phycisphaerae bacterium]